MRCWERRKVYPTLQIDGIALPLRPLLFLLGAWLCLTISERRMPRFGLEPDLAWNLGMLTGGVALVGARLWYALSHWSAYQSNLTGLVATSTSTLALNEGVALGLLVGLIYVQRQRAPWSRLADAFTPGLLAAFGLASLGALLSGDAYGAPTGLPWSIELWGAQRHPSQVYELLLALIVLGIGLRWLQRLPEGLSFLSASALYASGRVFVEAFRGDSIIIGDGVRVMQVAWLAIALLSVIAIYARQSDGGAPTRTLPGGPAKVADRANVSLVRIVEPQPVGAGRRVDADIIDDLRVALCQYGPPMFC